MKKSSIFVALSILILTIIWIGSGQFKQNEDKNNDNDIIQNSDTLKNEINVRTKY